MSEVLDREWSEDECGAFIRTFNNICKKWRIDDSDRAALLGLPCCEYGRLSDGANKCVGVDLPKSIVERIGYILVIYKNLHRIFEESEQEYTWLHGKHDGPMFGGKSPLEYMRVCEKNIINVLSHTEDWCHTGSWWEDWRYTENWWEINVD